MRDSLKKEDHLEDPDVERPRMGLTEIGWEDVDTIHLGQNKA